MLATRVLNWIFVGFTGNIVFSFGTLLPPLLACSFVQDQVSASSCEVESQASAYSAAVKDIEYV